MSEAVEILIKADDQASAKIVGAAAKTDAALGKNQKAFQETGRQAKSSAEFVGVLANTLGGSGLAGAAGQLGAIIEKVSAFSEVSKAGGAGATAFKVGLVGLAATIGSTIGIALGKIIFQTEKFAQELAGVNDEAARLDARLKTLAQNQFLNRKEDIELIQDPEEKRAAYRQLLDELNRDIATASAQAKTSQKAVEEWAGAWKITGDRTEYARQADEQAKQDKDRLAALQVQRDEIAKAGGERQRQIEEIRNAQEEQQKRELELVQEKAAAERQAMEEKKRAIEEAKREADRIEQTAAREKERVEGIITKERERLNVERIRITQGEEAARAQELFYVTGNEAASKELAAEEARLKALKEEQGAKQDGTGGKVASGPIGIQASESRLLTRGPSDRQTVVMERTLAATTAGAAASERSAIAAEQSAASLSEIKNKSGGVEMVPTL